MKLAAALTCVALCSVTVEAKTTADRVPYGRFALVTKVDDNSDHPIPDVESVHREIRLEWRSADRRVMLYFKDDGHMTTNDLVARPGTAADLELSENWGCSGGGQLQAYQSREKPSMRWRQAVKKEFTALLTTCAEWVSPAQRASYLIEAASAADDFGPALEAMKTAAQKQFGGWRRRCVKEKHVKNTWADFRCVRYSSKEY